MLRSTWVLLLAVAVVMTTFAVAGDHEKCKMSTQDCLDHMAAKMKNGGWMGVELDPDQATGGWSVLRVIPNSPAEAAGIQAGDVLTTLNGIRISDDNEDALMKARKEWKPGQAVNYTINRSGADRQVTVTLAPMPADVLARFIGQHMLEHAAVDVAEKK